MPFLGVTGLQGRIFQESGGFCVPLYAHRLRLFSDEHALGISTTCFSETKAVSLNMKNFKCL